MNGSFETSSRPAGAERNAVEVAPEAHVIDARDLGDVLDVIDDATRRHARERRGERAVLACTAAHLRGLRVARRARATIAAIRGRLPFAAPEPLVPVGVEKLRAEVDATAPPLAATARSMSSVMFRGWSAERPRRRVRREDRQLRGPHGVEERGVGDVRDVDHHPEAFIAATTRSAERREAAAAPVVAGAAAEAVRVRPGERHVPRAAIVEAAQPREELVVAARRRGECPPSTPMRNAVLSARGRGAHLAGRPREDRRVRVLRDEARQSRRTRASDVRVGLLAREELRAARTPRETRRRGRPRASGGYPSGRRCRRSARSTPSVDEALRHVVVGVDDDRVLVNREGGVARSRRRGGRRRSVAGRDDGRYQRRERDRDDAARQAKIEHPSRLARRRRAAAGAQLPVRFGSRQARSNGSRQACGATSGWITFGPQEPGE